MTYDDKRDKFEKNCDHVGKLLYNVAGKIICAGCSQILSPNQLSAKIQKDYFNTKMLLENTLSYKIKKIFNSPITYFISGCFLFSTGIIQWQTQVLNNFFIEHDISPLVGLLITGAILLAGFCNIITNYDEVRNKIRSRNSHHEVAKN